MYTISEIRRANLRRLIEQRFDHSAQRLAERLERSPSQISQWLNASRDSKSGKPRAMGSASARYIERRLGLPEGTMDEAAPDQGHIVGEPQRHDYSPLSTSEIDQLIHLATPRSQSHLKRIAQAAASGRLTDDDIALLEQIAERIARKA